MKILSAAAIAMLLLVGCSTTPDPTPSHPTWCNKDPKKEPHTHDCEDILPAHLPEECKPPEPPQPSKPATSTEPDPIVGTYRVFYTDDRQGDQTLLRVYPDGTAALPSNRSWIWERDDSGYRFSWRLNTKMSWLFKFSVSLQSLEGEPDLVTTDIAKKHYTSGNFEALKLSENPDLLLDFYMVGSFKGPKYKKDFYCVNVGHKQKTYQVQNGWGASFPVPYQYFADTEEECEAHCIAIIIEDYGSMGERTCPQHRR